MARAPVGAPASHIAVHPDMTYAVTGSSDPERALAVVDLRWWSATAYDTLGFAAIESADPGVAIGGHPPIIYHRFISPDFASGRLESLPVANILNADYTPTAEIPLETFPHGEVISHPLKRFCSAIDTGFACANLVGKGLEPRGLLPYDASGRSGGRAFYARVSGNGKAFTSHIQDAFADEVPWPDWQNDAYFVDWKSEQITRVPLGLGWALRFSSSDVYALYYTIHPEGDTAYLFDTNPKSTTFLQVVAKIPLDSLQHPLDPDKSPFDEGQQDRMTAITPDGRWGFVSHGGDGLISVIDTQARQVVKKLEVPTPLEGGGYLVAIQPDMKLGETIGR